MNNYQQDHRHLGVMPGPALSLSPSSSSPFHAQLGLRGLGQLKSWGVLLSRAQETLRRAQARTQHSHNKLAKALKRKRAEGILQERLSKDGPHLGSHELTFSLCIPRSASNRDSDQFSLLEICTSLLASIHTPCPLPHCCRRLLLNHQP